MTRDILTWKNLAGLLATLAILGLAGGYLGWLHPLGDSLAVLRPFAVVAVLAGSVLVSLAGMQLASFGSTLFALICGLQVFLAHTVAGPPGEILVYQKNMLFRNDDLATLEADIRAANPVVITLQEVSRPNLALLAALKDTYPAQHACPGKGVGGDAVASRLPMVEGSGLCAPGLAAMQVSDGGTRFWVVSIHLHWPWPYRQADHVRDLLPVLAGLEGPVVLGGDFNMVVGSHALGQIGAATRTVTAGPALGSYTGFDPWPRLAIDHVFAPAGGMAVLRKAAGSDHLGVLALVSL